MPPDLPPTEITVYNQGFGLVKEARTLALRKGRQTVGVEDVAAGIDPSSVAIRSLVAPDALTVLEQNYQYDLIGPASILAKAVGERLRVVGPEETVEGTLISSPGQNGGLVLRTDDGRIVLDPQGQVTLAKVPEGLITRPTLLWDVECDRDGAQNVELSYITQGLSWTADYVLTLDGAGKGALQGWVTMNNGSGATYRDARLKLLAGDVNQAMPSPPRPGNPFEAVPMAVKAAPGFSEESLFEYHLYTLGRPATLADKETKQLGLLSADAVPVVRRLVVDALRAHNRYYPSEGEVGTGELTPQARLEFVNDANSGLGVPLPAGRFRLYQRDASGATQLLGEDRIGHTPRDERVSLVAGRSFDVRATRLRTEFRRLGPKAVRESFSIEIRNRKDAPETVEVLERHWGDWSVKEKSQAFAKEDAHTLRFVVPLRAGETRKVTYTVETRW